jgi:hypothetical protein
LVAAGLGEAQVANFVVKRHREALQVIQCESLVD